MKPSEYKIDASTVDEKLFLSKTRQDWTNESFQLKGLLHKRLNLNTTNEDELIMNQHFIKSLQQKLDYIDEVLERFYVDMCIRCGKTTNVDTYCGQPEQCPHCFKNFMTHYLSGLTEEELDLVEKRINEMTKGNSPNGNKGID